MSVDQIKDMVRFFFFSPSRFFLFTRAPAQIMEVDCQGDYRINRDEFLDMMAS